MPKLFLDCVKKKGKIRTQNISKGRFRRICILDGKTFLGEIQTKKDAQRKKKKK